MYLPSLATGSLIARFGLTPVLVAGAVAMALGTVAGATGTSVGTYWLALVLVGIGWNLQFVGGTVLLTSAYRHAERFKAQALNDLVVYGGQAVTSLVAGAVLFRAGWATLNLLALPPLVAIVLIVLAWRRDLVRVAA
jgi:MFS family permease